MRTVERDIDRILAGLRKAMRERGYTQLEVQEVYRWGKSYISQLLTKQKSPSVEQVLLILKAIQVTPQDFFGDIYLLDEAHRPTTRRGRQAARATLASAASAHDVELRRMEALYRGLVTVLTRKSVIDAAALEHAIDTVRRGEVTIP